jgi:hypothetical protein
MKKLIIGMLLFVSTQAFSQVVVDDAYINELENVKYVELVGRNKIGFGKIKIIVDYGQPLKLFASQAIRSSAGTKVAFNSMIDGLNFMEANGWEYVSNYVIPARTETDENEIRYILRRKETK